MKFLSAVRLDLSDQNLYAQAARPGEWAVPGSFALWDLEPEGLAAPYREAFRHGFVGVESFGWTTLVRTVEIEAAELDDIVERLTEHLLQHCGAPDRAAARRAAQDEVDFTQSLCEHPLNTIIAVDRESGPEGIVESFRVVQPADAIDHSQVRLWGVEAG